MAEAIADRPLLKFQRAPVLCVDRLDNSIEVYRVTFMKRFLKSVTYAINGLMSALKTERNLRIDIAAMLIAIAFGFYLKLSINTWGLVILVIGFVLVAELFNTAIERLGDEAANGVQKQLIKRAKDIAAAGVLLSALTALILGILFLVIPFIQSFRSEQISGARY